MALSLKGVDARWAEEERERVLVQRRTADTKPQRGSARSSGPRGSVTTRRRVRYAASTGDTPPIIGAPLHSRELVTRLG